MAPSSAVAPQMLVDHVVGGRYRIVQLLGSGGTGYVYLAETKAPSAPISPDKKGGRFRVAVKALREEHRGKRDLLARFEREAKAAALVQHPNVLTVLEAPQKHGEIHYFVMELLVGLDLADTLAFTRAIGARRAARIVAGVAEGLAAAHAKGVVHRDLKPENIFLVHAPDGREQVKVLDFGFSFLPGEPDPVERTTIPRRTVVGTPEYMAPEQARGAPAHPVADIYSLGIVLYEMLAGCVPFTGPYPSVARRHATEAPPPLGTVCRSPITGELAAIVHKAISKDPESRFASMSELRDALLSAVDLA